MNGEIDMLEKIRRRAPVPRGSEVVLGIGDDCAIVRPRGAREDLLFTSDMLLDGVHFHPDTHSAEDVGHKALARGLSDVAAMGGEPRFCLLSLGVARWADERWVDGFYRGFLALARKTGTVLAGGDLARAWQVACDVTVCGVVPRGQALRRDGARPGDIIYVSGRLGGSALGLETRAGAPWKRHLRPEPRLRLGRFLREKLHATAAMDISDGLSLDLHRLCRASHVGAEIAQPPRYPGATLAQALHGGEDYELLFTVPPQVRVPASFERLPLERIGTIHKNAPGAVMMDGKPLEPLGYDHFREV